ncbi:MAG TPA: potassium channel family protein, partial [Alphaproteobacteria bacterium]|nr:potassium channel family protein [Alphaproteobacteria bacterium]
ASDIVPHLRIPPRPPILAAIAAAFFAHTVEVWVFAIAYYLLQNHFGIGAIGGEVDGSFAEFVYFSAETYTSLGFGDIYPIGGFRLVAGVEALVGLVMIGWSASFTFLEMQRYWELHPRRRGGNG